MTSNVPLPDLDAGPVCFEDQKTELGPIPDHCVIIGFQPEDTRIEAHTGMARGAVSSRGSSMTRLMAANRIVAGAVPGVNRKTSDTILLAFLATHAPVLAAVVVAGIFVVPGVMEREGGTF